MKIRPLALLAALALTVACATPSTAAEAAKPVKIGVAGAHSGDLASYGLPTLKAAQLIVKDINERGGLNGRPVDCSSRMMSASRRSPPTRPPSWSRPGRTQ